MKQYRLDSQHFSRDRIFTFSIVLLTILNNIHRSVSVEITKFLSTLGSALIGSKQAFSKARYKLDWRAFVALNDDFVLSYYQFAADEAPVSRPQLYADKYLLLATDGSDYELPCEAALIEAFGVVDTAAKVPFCMAKGVKIWDILNKITLSSHLGRYDDAEIQLFKLAWRKSVDLLTQVNKSASDLCSSLRHATILLLADMHYPSFWLFYEFIEQCKKCKSQDLPCTFLFRCPISFCREIEQFMATDVPEAIIDICIQSDGHRRRRFLKQTKTQQAPEYLRIRAVQTCNEKGEKICFVTGILDTQEMPYQQIIDLYKLRWGEETSFGFDKNRTEIENFSAKMPLGIRQDWYANTLMTNLGQLMIEQAQRELDEKQKNKDNKYHYQINRSVAMGILKDELPKMIFGYENPISFQERMIKLIIRNSQPIRPNRKAERQKKHKLKFSMNLRRCL